MPGAAGRLGEAVTVHSLRGRLGALESSSGRPKTASEIQAERDERMTTGEIRQEFARFFTEATGQVGLDDDGGLTPEAIAWGEELEREAVDADEP